MNIDDEIEALRRSVEPVTKLLGPEPPADMWPMKHARWKSIESVAMLVVAQARADALREVVRPEVGYNVRWDADAAGIRAVDALTDAEALVARLTEVQR